MKNTEPRLKHDYNFFYHYNTFSKEWGAMTSDSVGHYLNRDFEKGNFAFGKTQALANVNLTAKMEAAEVV